MQWKQVSDFRSIDSDAGSFVLKTVSSLQISCYRKAMLLIPSLQMKVLADVKQMHPLEGGREGTSALRGQLSSQMALLLIH